MRANFDLFLTELSSLNNYPLLIFLTEIFIFDDEVENYKINNYVSHANCNNTYKSGGVIVFSRTGIKCDVISTRLKSADILRVNTIVDGQIFVFICIYRLHSCTVNIFVSDLMIYLNKIKCKNLVILGDLNINILDNSFLYNSKIINT